MAGDRIITSAAIKSAVYKTVAEIGSHLALSAELQDTLATKWLNALQSVQKDHRTKAMTTQRRV